MRHDKVLPRTAGSSKTAQSGVERIADGDVSVDGQQKDRPDGGSLRARRCRPDVGLESWHIGNEHSRQPVGRVDEGLGRLDKETCNQVDCVNESQRLQQQVRRV